MVLVAPLHRRDTSEDLLLYNHLRNNSHCYEKPPFDTDLIY